MAAGRRFFATEEAVKRRVQVETHARARQDNFAHVEELAARSADLRNVFFEAQLTLGNDDVRAATSGSHLSFLPDVPGLREPVLDYMRSLSGLSHKLMALLARGLRLADISSIVTRAAQLPRFESSIIHRSRTSAGRQIQRRASVGSRGF
jgi:isopenicillin N synthase-like dioxygenase